MEYVELPVFVKPNARKTAVIGAVNNVLHIALHAKPKEGEANTELINFLSLHLKMAKTHIRLIRGGHSRHKVLVLPVNKNVTDLLEQYNLSLKVTHS